MNNQASKPKNTLEVLANHNLNWVSHLSRKPVKIPSLDGKVKYLLIGRDIDRPTFIYFYPEQLPQKLTKYAARKQRLIGPVYQPPVPCPTINNNPA
jgi:hypothetical protein